MRIKIQNFLYRLRQSFWFMPALLATTAILLSRLTTALDRAISYHTHANLGWLYHGGTDGAQTILSVISSSMITVAGVVFSITIVVLSLASSQFGPRLIRNFMNVRANQMVLGTFVATYIYSILVLHTVSSVEGRHFVPGFSVSVAVLMSLTSLGVLIFFIHSVSESIQAQNIVSKVRRDLDDAVDRIFPEKLGHEETPDSNPIHRDYDIPTTCDRDACPIKSDHSGYLQALDSEALMRIAVEENLLVHLGHRPGQFVTQGSTLVTVWPGDKVDEALSDEMNALFILGPERTLEQDVEFAISQLVEIAVRALSPGINDPITAIACIDWLGSILCQLANRKMPSSHRYDERNRLRVIAKTFAFEGMVDAAFNMIRQNARNNTAVSIHLLETITTIGPQVLSEANRSVLLKHATMVAHGCRKTMSTEGDREDLDRRFESAVRVLNGEG